MGRSYWYKKWQADKSFIVENDILKEKVYLYTPFPKMNQYGFQGFKIRELIYTDILARFYRMRDKNVLFPLGFNSLSNSSYLESRRNSNSLDGKIQEIFYNQMLELGLGVNEAKLIDLRRDDFVYYLQRSFIDLYTHGYIKYEMKEVIVDKENNKIYDEMNKIGSNNIIEPMLVFTLDIKDIVKDIALDIESLQCNSSLKEKLISLLKPEDIIDISLSLSNNKELALSLKAPELMGGISYILINPEYIDIMPYISADEEYSVMDYLENGGRAFAYSGISAKNPLTGKDIPIFISTLYEVGVYPGIPGFYKEDRALALEYGLNIIEILEDDKLINSDIIDGCTLNEGRIKLIECFQEAEIGLFRHEYLKSEIIISSLDSFGPLFPFLRDKDNRLNPLTNNLPFNFSNKFRPTLQGDIQINGEPLNGTINSLFIDGMLPFLSILYDPLGEPSSIFSTSSAKELEAFSKRAIIVVDEDSYINDIFMPIVFNNIIKKEIPTMPSLVKKVVAISKCVDNNNQVFKRSNNNLIDFSRYLSFFYSDSIRLFTMLKPYNEALVVDKDLIEEIDILVRAIEERLLNIDDSKASTKLDFYFYKLLQDSIKYLDNMDVSSYIQNIYSFIKNVILEEYISKAQCLLFIKCILPIMPYLADEIYKKIFNSKYSLINESL